MTAARPDQTLVHFYRAAVAHMDVWRQRMDATTNWAAATGAGMITFTFSTPGSPHFVLLLAVVFQAVFLIMESRRYQTYDLWRRRFRTLNQHLVVPSLTGDGTIGEESSMRLSELAVDLGRTVPHLSTFDAVGYRLRRNYGYLLGVTLLAWTLKLETHPSPTPSPSILIERARVGALPGAVVVAVVGLLVLGGMVLILRAPSEQMMNWTAVPSPYRRWGWGLRRNDPPAPQEKA